jgi:hypothetical protein
MVPTIKERPPRHRLIAVPRLPELRVAFAKPGITPAELARILKRRAQDISDVMYGHRVNLKIAEEIATYFGKPLDELFLVIDLENPDKTVAA